MPPADELRLPPLLRRVVPDLSDEVVRRRFQWVIAVLMAAGFVSCLAVGGQRPADPGVDATTAASTIEGFDQLAFRIRPSPSHPELEALAAVARCALLAESPEQHRQGLKGVTDLGGYDGMLFRFDDDVFFPFTMEGTPMPLVVAFFDVGGHFVSKAVMDPCPEGADCPSHPAEAPYRYALEVPQGQLAAMGAGPGSRLVLGGVCSGGGPAAASAEGATG